MHVDTLEEGIAMVNDRAFGNMACIFTASGAAARQFRHRDPRRQHRRQYRRRRAYGLFPL
jgi:hypothetical protein